MRFVVFAVALALTAGVSSQELMPGTARPLLKDLPSTTSGFICPMHPNEVKATPGTYLTLTRSWKENDTIELRMPFSSRTSRAAT